MYNLLSAGFTRLRKGSGFWIVMTVMFAISVSTMLLNCRTAIRIMESGYTRNLSNFYFNLAPLIGLFCAVFISFFIGKEYSDGTIRNKLIVGHTRAQVYISNFIVSLAACEGFVVMWIIGGLAGIPVLGIDGINVRMFAVYILLVFLFTAAFTGIFVMMAMLISNKSFAIAATIIFLLILIIIGSGLYAALLEPETISDIVMTLDGIKMGEPEANPAYIGGTLRTIYQFIVDSLPTSQAMMMTNSNLARPVLSAAASVVIAAGTTSAGIAAFTRKDLK